MVSVVQPMILPLHDQCVSEIELLLALLDDKGALVTGERADGAPAAALAAVRETFLLLEGAGEEAWKTTLREGFHAGSGFVGAGPPQVDIEGSKALVKEALKTAPATASPGVVFAADASI